jgi:hypothetical protein
MRTLACTLLVSSLLLACSGDGNMATTQSTRTVDPTADSSSDPTNASTPTGTEGATQTSGTTQTPGTTEAGGSSTVSPTTTAGPDTDATATAGSSSSATTGGDAGLMGQYGHACETDADCIAVLGDGGKCLTDILMVYNLPGGYCSTDCDLPDQQHTYISMAADCKLGADCVGLMGFFEGCAFPCTDSSQCPRDGYECRQMPEISNPGDPTYCLMTEDNKI